MLLSPMFKLRKQTEASTCGLPGVGPLFPESVVSGLSAGAQTPPPTWQAESQLVSHTSSL